MLTIASLALLPAFVTTVSAEPAWTMHVDPSNQIYPSMVIALATAKSAEPDAILDLRTDEEKKIDEEVAKRTLGDAEGWIYITVKAPKENTAIKVTVSCDDVMEPSTFKGVIEKADTLYGVAPKIKWKYKELAKIRQPIPTNVTFKVTMGDAEEVEDFKVCTIHAINDCVYRYVSPIEGTDLVNIHDLTFLFAGYVNEDHPWIDTFLKEALDTKVVENFTGYQEGTEDAVFQQVYAVWNALQRRGVTYSDITRVSAKSDNIGSQHVRFLDETVAMKQANCVDGSVLMASILRKIGIDVFLMLVPGHCYIGFYTDAEREHMVGFETTLIGKASREKFDGTKKLRELLDDKSTFDDASFASFEAALAVGSKNLKEAVPKLEAGEFQYMQVLLKEAREQGVKPIPYTPAPKADAPGLRLDDLKINR